MKQTSLQCDQTTWNRLVKVIQEEDFEPIGTQAEKKSVKFDYSSKRDEIWQVAIALSLVLGFVLVSLLSIPIGFFIAAGFVYLKRRTDDHFLLDGQDRAFVKVTSFLGRSTREVLVRFDQTQSVSVKPVERRSGGAVWTEFWLGATDEHDNFHAFLAHPESRSKRRAEKIGEAVAAFLGVPFRTSEG